MTFYLAIRLCKFGYIYYLELRSLIILFAKSTAICEELYRVLYN